VTFRGSSGQPAVIKWRRSSRNNLATLLVAAREFVNMGSGPSSSTAVALVVMWMTWRLGIDLVMDF
jgi:hypothetical protein